MDFILVVVVDEFLVLLEEQVFDCLLFCPGSSVEIDGETMAGDE